MTASRSIETYDAAVIGGGPAGATAAHVLAHEGHRVALIDKAGRIKPCGGAIPPRLIRDFGVPPELLCARISSARMVSPSARHVDMPIEGGFVGMVDREVFDEYLRWRAAEAGAERITGTYRAITREEGDDACPLVHYRDADGTERELRARLVIGADGALSKVARQEVSSERPAYVFAYHEILRAPEGSSADGYDGSRCDVVYDGSTSPDFYGWVFPHGKTVSVGSGSAQSGFKLRDSVATLRGRSGLADAATVRREGAPIPMKPLKRWDNGRDVLLAGDAAGVVAPASGEGIYYAMVGGELSALAGAEFLETGNAKALKLARKTFMKAHGRVFWILGIMQHFWYKNDKRRERFVSICDDPDVQSLTWQAYMNKELVRAKPAAHVRIFFKDMAHLLGLVSPT
ncbi:MAG TPA: geranylgeranyl diphosphate reductase [Sandaracinaceae bacterium LLY-WYZ-13_1]|nr:geranylgeranyl diphosphate reductase [Sandaracinaceae bacterium LLY-WYZ-13_1]